MGASFVRVVVGNSFAKDRFKEICLNDEDVEKLGQFSLLHLLE